ncbi:hypothetical protein VTK26DRAFT_5063 [Humicola hyalothermophila]
MRLRNTRGVRKRYTEEPIGFDDDDEPILVPEDKSKDDDFEAPSDGPDAPEDDDDDHEEEAVPTSDEDEAGLNEGEAGRKTAESSQPKKQRRDGAGKMQDRKNLHEIPHYPLETRIVTRVYAGPLRRYARYSALRDAMYGPEYERIKVIWDLEIRWTNFPVLPPRLPPEDPQGVLPSPWLPRGFERSQERRACHWYDAYQLHAPEMEAQRSRPLPREQVPRFVPQSEDLLTLVGPWNKQEEFVLGQGGCLPLGPKGLPVSHPEPESAMSSGWMLNVGGIPLATAWAPLSRQDIQLLAVAAIPFSDQASSALGAADTDPSAATAGCIQFWEFVPSRQTAPGLASPSMVPPRLLGVKCFNWGRPRRLQFSPVPMDSAGTAGMLAVLCGDGKARIIDAKNADIEERSFFEIESPVVTLGLTEDYNVAVTCLTWVNTNRIALGHTDGSITLWSVSPRKLLQRVGVHTTYVIDICSAYPSNPFMVASIPVGGCATLTDLSQPSSECTYFPVPAISFQPNLLCWNETMQGFMALYPSSTPNTTVAFLHHRFFCQARSICTGPNTLTCVSAGHTHPFILVGCADGSVFSCNALQKLFKQKGEPLRKLKIFEHEYRPFDPGPQQQQQQQQQHEQATEVRRPLRGAVRILQGFLPEPNDDPRTEKRKEMDRKKRAEKMKRSGGAGGGGKKKGRPRKNNADGLDAGGEEDREAEIDEKLASRVVIHEPLTRVTAIQWNPNVRFSCWAACAMASGLIKVMDLGVE